ncbi:MAG: hypothetical protein ABIR18_04870 [Chitinophagaceae bacterium]
MKKAHFLNDPIKNIVTIILLTVLAYMLTLSFYFSNGPAATFRYLFYPCFIALGTLTVYLASLLYFKKYNWIISLTGVSWMFYFSFLLNSNVL